MQLRREEQYTIKKQRPLLREVKKEKRTFNRYNVARFSYPFQATDIHFIF